jgi:hypothetical protein
MIDVAPKTGLLPSSTGGRLPGGTFAAPQATTGTTHNYYNFQ